MTVLASQPSVSIETDTTQRIDSAEAALLADRVHHLAKKILIGDALASAARRPVRVDDVAAEPLDLVRGHRAEFVVERFAGFELFAIDQERARAGQAVAVLVVIAEQRQPTVLKRGGPSSFSRLKPEM